MTSPTSDHTSHKKPSHRYQSTQSGYGGSQRVCRSRRRRGSGSRSRSRSPRRIRAGYHSSTTRSSRSPSRGNHRHDHGLPHGGHDQNCPVGDAGSGSQTVRNGTGPREPALLRSVVHPARSHLITHVHPDRHPDRVARRQDLEPRQRHPIEPKSYHDVPLPIPLKVYPGRVRTIKPFGCFVDLSGFVRLSGLVHISQLAERRVENVEDFVTEGENVYVKIIDTDNDGKIRLTMKGVSQGDGRDLDPTHALIADSSRAGGTVPQLTGANAGAAPASMGTTRTQTSLPELYSIHKGKVESVREFGAFVSMAGYRSNGLVHITQISEMKTEKVSDILEVGDEVFVKVIALEDGKVSLSMKYAQQGTGRDLDANNVALEASNSRRKPHWKEPPPIQLEAVLNATCPKCGGKGHIATECWNRRGEHFDLVGEGDIPTDTVPGHNATEPEGNNVPRNTGPREHLSRRSGSSPDLPEAVTSMSDAVMILKEALKDRSLDKATRHALKIKIADVKALDPSHKRKHHSSKRKHESHRSDKDHHRHRRRHHRSHGHSSDESDHHKHRKKHGRK